MKNRLQSMRWDKKKMAIAVVAIVVVLVSGLFVYADRRSCICYEVEKGAVTRPKMNTVREHRGAS